MNKYLKLLPLSFCLLCSVPLTSCGGDVSPYVGTYYVETSYEKCVHYAYGNKNEIYRREVSGIPVGSTIVINEDRSVIFNYPDGETEVKGSLAVSYSGVRFRNLNFSNAYKFKLDEKSGYKKLVHEYSEDKHALEYDEESRYIVLVSR